MDLPLSSNNCISRAGLETQHTCLTSVFLDTVRNQIPAHQGTATLLVDVFLVFLPEVPDRGNNWIWDGLPQTAYGTCFDCLCQLQKHLDITGSPFSPGNVRKYVEHLLCSQLAQGALATGLVLGKIEEVASHIYHAGIFIHHQHPPGSHDGAGFRQGLVVHREIQKALRDATPRGATGLHSLEFPVFSDPATNVKDDLSHGRSHGNFYEARVFHISGQGKDLCPFAFLRAYTVEPRCTMKDNSRHTGKSLHIVQYGRHTPEPDNTCIGSREWFWKTPFAFN